jgi:hypothetical protein
VVVAFFDTTAGQLVTSPICIAQVLGLLGASRLMDLLPEDYARIAELTLDSDSDVYRRFRREPCCRVSLD